MQINIPGPQTAFLTASGTVSPQWYLFLSGIAQFGTLTALGNYANDAAAAAAGVKIGAMYRNGSVLMVRVS